ncbi:MAG: response regulator transcription factor [Bacteroidetes bacterium]|nr:response regulator transcription factor [Bacteroidota bacterium]MCW5896783.1 response regulator transcription factor [Bacteroidota bacterium]
MSKLKCIIVEDEPLAVKILAEYISQVPFLELQGTFKDAIYANEYLQENPVDVMFLDIHLPKLKGFAFLRALKHPPLVIVTTAYHQYAVEGFNLNVTDYLLKPFDFERFLVAANKARTALRERLRPEAALETKEHLFVNVKNKKVKILFPEIVYIESQREYVKIVTAKNEYVTKMSTHEIERLLPAGLFKRIHRSFIVSIGKIDSYTAEKVEVNGISIPIGKGYRGLLDNL